eukprot:CAMPEP_0115652880 /NCGR_PEP_ID=MMETSP0272-20121206/42302_1 /TAXON_ID=71861 /ORGANISM="Scrippsiella trochoidea, Strain CCMP3099" /LENGTH=44 /DNA_ID= /DNA_START= /DNA_END= /DNA_ORIENTATION=
MLFMAEIANGSSCSSMRWALQMELTSTASARTAPAACASTASTS